jgi:tRNA pseudouridine55 synthase
MSDYSEGEVLLINKPLRWTSFDVVRKIRNELKIKKVGHAGTLDPLATGLLIICTGKYTKRIQEYQDQEKEYTGTMRLGATTPSYDLETEPDEHFDISRITEKDILAAAERLTGKQMQVPPLHSAKQIGGERAYEKARRGEKIKLEPREVFVRAFDITGINMPDVNFRIICSKGTYIRSLAFDLGRELGAGAHLASLCRTRIGDFRLENATELEDFIEKVRAFRAGNLKS